MFGVQRRRVFFCEKGTLLPNAGFLPLILHLRDMRRYLLDFFVNDVPSQKRIVLLDFQSFRIIPTILFSHIHVTAFSAFQANVIADAFFRHDLSLFSLDNFYFGT